MGGAVQFSKNIQKYANMFKKVVNGSIKNVFSKHDQILILYMISTGNTHPIGREPMEIDNMIQNIDVSNNITAQLIGMGHIKMGDLNV